MNSREAAVEWGIGRAVGNESERQIGDQLGGILAFALSDKKESLVTKEGSVLGI